MLIDTLDAALLVHTERFRMQIARGMRALLRGRSRAVPVDDLSDRALADLGLRHVEGIGFARRPSD